MSKFFEWLRWLAGREQERDFFSSIRRLPLPPIAFAKIETVEKPLPNSDMREGIFYFVSLRGKSKWVLFHCPCGCKTIITLSLQDVHNPRWILRKGRAGRPTLEPSVWRDVGCMSHFVLFDGRVYWAGDTGRAPPAQRIR